MWKPADYLHVIRDSRAGVLVVSAELLPLVEKILHECRSIRHIIVKGSPETTHTHTEFGVLMARGTPHLDAEPTSRDAPSH